MRSSMRISLVALLRVLGGVGALTGCSLRAPATPAPLSPAAAAASPLEALAGTIAISRRHLEGHFDDAAFAAALPKLRIDRIPSLEQNDPDGPVVWQIEYFTFLAQPLRGGFVRTAFYDLTDGAKRLVAAQDQGAARSDSMQRTLIDTLQLLGPEFAPQRHYQIAVELDGKAVAVTTFWLLDPGESAAARASTISAAGLPGIPDEPSGPFLGDDLDPPQDVQRVPGSHRCASTTRAPVEGRSPQTAPGSRSDGVRRPPTMDRAVLLSGIKQHIPAVKACYEARMIDPPYPEGKLVSRFAINRAGKVSYSCAVESTLNDPLIDRCILEDILHWEFVKPRGGGWVVVQYPFVLEPERP